jgi:hypothetical protein
MMSLVRYNFEDRCEIESIAIAKSDISLWGATEMLADFYCLTD